MSKKGKLITTSIISQSGMTKRFVLSDQLLITHYSLLILLLNMFNTLVLSDQLLITHYSLLITDYSL